MYIIESLKKSFPAVIDEIMSYDSFLHAHFPDVAVSTIFSDDKENYFLIQEAFAQLSAGNRDKYSEFMAKYSKTMNTDPDFLRYFIKSFFKDDTDTSTWSVAELQTYVNKKLDKESA